MEKFYGGGGRQNPDFRYKVRVKRPCDGAYEWCEEYPVVGSGYFQRWYLDTKEFDQGYMTFQFEIKEAATMFLLTWGGEYL